MARSRERNPVRRASGSGVALLAATLLLPAALLASPVEVTGDALEAPGGLDLTQGWSSRTGDQLEWAQPSGTLQDGFEPAPPTDALGRGARTTWFLVDLDLAPEVRGREVGAFLELIGSAQLFVDGRLQANLGRLSVPAGGPGLGPAAQRHFALRLPAHERVRLAVRYQAHTGGLQWTRFRPGFRLRLGAPSVMRSVARHWARTLAGFQGLFVGAFLFQAVMHLLMFVYMPVFRSNAWFSATAAVAAFHAALFFEQTLTTSASVAALFPRVGDATLFLSMIVFLRFTYEVYDRPRGRVFWALLVTAIVCATIVAFSPSPETFARYAWFYALVLVDAMWSNVGPLRSGWRGAPFIALGIGAFAASILWLLLIIFRWVEPPFEPFPVPYFGLAVLLLSLSAYLARKFAQAGEALEQRSEHIEELTERTQTQELEARQLEIERRILESDNERKTRELEEARELQLAFLPREIPKTDHVEVAVAMRTATEVGGDYYDFCLSEKGGLAAVLGDAAGHGARAGTMVSLMKGLFSSFRAGMDIPRFFSDANAVVRGMQLRGANTAMAIAYFEPGRLTYSSAGVPPALLLRDGRTEELLVEGMPLGSFHHFRYTQLSRRLQEGDLVLMMSDGLAELENENGEQLGYPRLQEWVAGAPPDGAQAMIDHLLERARQWSGGEALEDDVTLLAVRVVATQTAEEDLAALRRFLPI